MESVVPTTVWPFQGRKKRNAPREVRRSASPMPCHSIVSVVSIVSIAVEGVAAGGAQVGKTHALP